MQPNQEKRGWSFKAIWVALMLVVSIGIADAILAPAPTPEQPDFIDTVLASRAVVVSIRLAIIFAAVYVILSVAALTARRQWLARVGPVEVEKVSGLDAENRQLKEWLEAAHKTIEELEGNVANRDQLVEGPGT